MPNGQHKLSRLRDLLAIIGFLVGGFWVLWIFVFEKVIEPRLAPQDLSIDARLQKGGERGGMLAVKIYVSVKNQSSRTVYIPEAAMLLTGRVIQRTTRTSDEFLAIVNKQFAQRTAPDSIGSVIIKQKEIGLIGAGSFLTNWKLEPNETASRNRVMYVDASHYDQLVLVVNVIEARDAKLNACSQVKKSDGGDYDLAAVVNSTNCKTAGINPETKIAEATCADRNCQFALTIFELDLWSAEGAAGSGSENVHQDQ